MNASILFVDDDESLRETTRYHLEKEGFKVWTARDGEEGLRLFEERTPDLVVTDLVMPRMDGLALLKKIREVSEDAPVVVVTAHGSIGSAVDAMKLGACDYIEKPFSADALKLSLRKALRMSSLEKENRYLRQFADEGKRFENIVGRSEKMREVLRAVSLLAGKTATVLIQGESGTGKELIARALHFGGGRRSGPFVAINTGALPESLVDSELFGHEKGSFTGAASRHAGAFERADGGTLFLDEIAEMRPELQARLLRVLQESEILRVGGERPIPIDVRVIAASNKNLEKAVEEGDFREDLYYRLAVASIVLPPLRDRPEDIPALLDRFLDKFQKNSTGPKLKVSREALKILTGYRWPGNVREFENAVEQCVALCPSDVLRPEDLPEKIRRAPGPKIRRLFDPADLPEEGVVLEEIEKDLIRAALEKNRHNQSETARYLGITRNTLLYRMEKFGLKRN